MVIFRNWLILATLIFSLTARAEVAELAISQVDVYLPDIKIYTNLLDENKQPLSPDGLAVRVNLDGNQVEFAAPPAIFKTTGKGVAYTFLLDVSGSMKGEPYKGAIEAIKGLFNQMNQHDVVAVLTFGDEVQTITDFTRPNQALFDTLRGITPDAQKTHFYEAIQQAFILNKRREAVLPMRRAILVITDGKDEGSGIRLDDLLDNEIKRQSIPIYSVGFSKLRRQDKEKFLDELKRISNLSGGAYVRSDAYSGFAEIYTKTFGDIQEQMYISVRAPEEMRADGKPRMLQVVVADGNGKQISDEKAVFFLDAQVIVNPSNGDYDKGFIFQPWHYVAMVLGGILLLLLMIGLIVRRQQKVATTTTDVEFQAPPPSTRNNDILPEQAGWHDRPDEQGQTQGFDDNIGEGGAIVGETVSDIAYKSVQEHFFRKLEFIVTDGHDEGMRGSLSVGEKGIIIGRQGPEVRPNIVLTDPKVSRPHCLLQAGKEWFSVKNQSKTRSTFVNGIRINEKYVFKDEECVINIGDTTLRINLFNLN